MNTTGSHPEPDTRNTIESDPAYDFAEDATVDEDWDGKTNSSIPRRGLFPPTPRQWTTMNGLFRWTRTTSSAKGKATKPKRPFHP